MLLKERSAKECTKPIVELLYRLKSLIEENDFNPKILKIQSLGFHLDYISNIGYSVTGIFKKDGYKTMIQIPTYKINEDILDMLESLVDEHNYFIMEKQNQTYGNTLSIKKKIIDLKSKAINWHKVYNTKIYAQIALNTAIELLYAKINKKLKTIEIQY